MWHDYRPICPPCNMFSKGVIPFAINDFWFKNRVGVKFDYRKNATNGITPLFCLGCLYWIVLTLLSFNIGCDHLWRLMLLMSLFTNAGVMLSQAFCTCCRSCPTPSPAWSALRISLFILSQHCSMGLRSGVYAGQVSILLMLRL